jgi:hypothetical protein
VLGKTERNFAVFGGVGASGQTTSQKETKMKGKSILVALTLFLSSFVSTAEAAPKWFANLQLKITGVLPAGFTEEGLLADVTFQGKAGGPHIKNGTVVGVDHAVFDVFGNAHLNVYLTITDKDGGQISANITGLAVPVSPGKYVLEEASGTIIDEPDPDTGELHATTGKFAHMVGDTFEDVGFITGFSVDPPAGSVHAKWYLD